MKELTEHEDELLKFIKYQLAYMKTQRAKFEDRWREAQNYVAKSVYDWASLEAIPKAPVRYSSDPCNYMNTLTSGLLGYSISPNIAWFKLTLEDEKMLDRYGVKRWLDEVEEIMYAEFNRSNLYSEAKAIVENACTIGHGTMLEDYDYDRQKLRFNAQRMNEVYLDTDEYNEVTTLYRTYLMPLKKAADFFGLENLSEKLQEAYKEEHGRRWNDNITILFAVFKRTKYNKEIPNSLNMPYAAVYVELDEDHIIQESGYNDFPYAVFEWDNIPGTAYSESPAMAAMQDIIFLNKANKATMDIAQTSSRPPMIASEDILDIDTSPAGITYVKNGDMLEPLQTGANYPITIDILEKIKQTVKDWFNVDFFLMLQHQQRQMTATEVSELQGEKAAVLSNLIVSFNKTLTQIVQRSFNLLWDEGKIPAPPENMAESNSALKVEFMGPLAQAQKRYHQAGGINVALQYLAPMAQLFPESLDLIDQDETMKKLLIGNGMPQSAIREDKDVEAIRQARAEQNAAMQQQAVAMEMQKNILNNAGQLNQPEVGNSIMNNLNEQLAGSMSQ
ncbi:MAG: portal protein [Fibrobacter sp.]|nr:portal protein [Fibrobacter sp.]